MKVCTQQPHSRDIARMFLNYLLCVCVCLGGGGGTSNCDDEATMYHNVMYTVLGCVYGCML